MKKRFLTNRYELICKKCKDKTVLDLGCANHAVQYMNKFHWLHGELAKVAKKLVGIDCEPDAVDYMNINGFTIYCEDVQNFDITPQYPELFDVVVAGEIIEHLTNPRGFIESAMKHLKPGGELIITTPHNLGFIFFLEALLTGSETLNDDHTMTFSKKQLTKFLEKCGYKVSESYYVNECGCNRHEWYAKFLYKPLWWLQCLVSFIQPGLSRGIIVIVRK